MKKRKKKTVEQRAASLVNFIDGTLGGKLGTFRCYLPAEPGPAREAILRARRLSSNPAVPPPVSPHD